MAPSTRLRTDQQEWRLQDVDPIEWMLDAEAIGETWIEANAIDRAEVAGMITTLIAAGGSGLSRGSLLPILTGLAIAGLLWVAPADAAQEPPLCDRFDERTVSQDGSGRVLSLSATEFVASFSEAYAAGEAWCMELANDVIVRIPNVPEAATTFGDWSAPAFVSTQVEESWIVASVREGSVRARVPDLLGFNYVFETSRANRSLLEVSRVMEEELVDDVEPPPGRAWSWPLALGIAGLAAVTAYGINRSRRNRASAVP